jgi:hypothetical protein
MNELHRDRLSKVLYELYINEDPLNNNLIGASSDYSGFS